MPIAGKPTRARTSAPKAKTAAAGIAVADRLRASPPRRRGERICGIRSEASASGGDGAAGDWRASAGDGAPAFSEEDRAQVRASLLSWYDGCHRQLPWRRNLHSKLEGTRGEAASADLDPQAFAYMVWVSEVMLQQTQVVNVVKYFKRWMEKWPTLEALAAASLEEVNELWAGLGYYRRAAFLLKGAKHLVDELGGAFPETANELKRIPGIGPYTSAAVASIAFGECAAAVDGNVIRVVSRLRALSGDPKKLTATHAVLAGELLDKQRPGDFNQAMMELGATICKPTNPLCDSCPVSAQCSALARVRSHLAGGGRPDKPNAPRVTDFPSATEKLAKREEVVAMCVLKMVPREGQRGRYMLLKRPASGLLAGLWEFPTIPIEGGDTTCTHRQSKMDEYLQAGCGTPLGKPPKKLKVLRRHDVGTAVHLFSHIRMTMHVEMLVVEGGQEAAEAAEKAGVRWVAEGEMGSFGLTTMVRKAFKLAEDRKREGTDMMQYLKGNKRQAR
ncbi:unnamed protein product [Ostreobium quekettii]|uniref:Adenine DNA glycosylase n=1 Tax=Ostreobium quekettii TaxID=121088 RepID=A0A8S1JA04_9CHLO|nr:unnamed protein product [Ostreobium quekettii]|eukprot:evm.model.scf_595.5 EVM.evm.TU.scf_595.5   scf_595:66209-75858(-)